MARQLLIIITLAVLALLAELLLGLQILVACDIEPGAPCSTDSQCECLHGGL